MLPTIGSTIDACDFPRMRGRKPPPSCGISLKGSARVQCAISSGTPAEPGMPKVATPDPAFTSSPSECP